VPDTVAAPEYGDAFDRLAEALETAGLDKGLAVDLDRTGSEQMFKAIDREREGVLGAVSRLVGSG
jgi:hypothetical protein